MIAKQQEQDAAQPPPMPAPAVVVVKKEGRHRDYDYDHVFEANTARPATLKRHFERHGFVIVRVLDRAQCEANIKAQITGILLKQPWRDRLVVRDSSQQELDIERDTARYIAELTRPNLDKRTLQSYTDVWPFHAGFGACCDPNAFHLAEMWRVREDPRLYEIASSLLGGRRDLWVDINRPIQKLPGKGEEEFLHWDMPILHATHTPDEAIGGKVMFTDGQFVCVPGTATAAFHREFCEEYAQFYPKAKKSDAKFGLDHAKPDPMGLAEKKVAVRVPAGCAIFWSQWLLHGVQKNPRKGSTQFGMYLGYMPAESRAAYQRKTKPAISERDDRVRSFEMGIAPTLWPSLDRVHYYPYRYVNIHRNLQPYIDKTRPGYPGLTRREVKSKPGTWVDDIVPVRDPEYVPPRLTELGYKLLGLYNW
jgi:hypothetical protein